jgi:hypothetical protein
MHGDLNGWQAPDGSCGRRVDACLPGPEDAACLESLHLRGRNLVPHQLPGAWSSVRACRGGGIGGPGKGPFCSIWPCGEKMATDLQAREASKCCSALVRCTQAGDRNESRGKGPEE